MVGPLGLQNRVMSFLLYIHKHTYTYMHIHTHPYLHIHECVPNHFSHVQFFATLWAVAHQAPLSMGFPRQEYWSGLPLPPLGNLPDPGMEPAALYVSCIGKVGSLPLAPPGKTPPPPTHTLTYTRTYLRIYIHACTHIYIHAYTYIYVQICFSGAP